jgi:VWFA-related protein
MRLLPLALLSFSPLAAETKFLVTVVEQKTARPVVDLKSSDFTVTGVDSPLRVLAAEFKSAPIDVMLLVDSSLRGQLVQSTAAGLIDQIEGKEQMALVAYHTSADLLQDFTSSKQSLSRALSGVKYGNDPKAIDAIYAAIDGGFEHAVFRKVILLVTSGYEGKYSQVLEKNVVQLARKNGVSIYPLYLSARERTMFESLARQTGGAPMKLKDLSGSSSKPAARVFEVMRGSYTLILSGNLPITGRSRIEVNRPGKFSVSALPVD